MKNRYIKEIEGFLSLVVIVVWCILCYIFVKYHLTNQQKEREAYERQAVISPLVSVDYYEFTQGDRIINGSNYSQYMFSNQISVQTNNGCVILDPANGPISIKKKTGIVRR